LEIAAFVIASLAFVTLTLERRRVCGGYRRYTRLRWKFVNESPKPTKNVPVYTTKRMVCPH